LDAGMYAPSGGDDQSAVFIVVQDKTTLDKLSQLNSKVRGVEGQPYYGAPTVILVLAEKNKRTPIEDGCLALGNMLNAAASVGLGSCWVHRTRQMFETQEGKDLLKMWGLLGDYIGVGSCILGYPDEPVPKASPRKDDFIYYVR
jgi:nitroreductase